MDICAVVVELFLGLSGFDYADLWRSGLFGMESCAVASYVGG